MVRSKAVGKAAAAFVAAIHFEKAVMIRRDDPP